MPLLQAPKSAFTNQFELYKYRLTWHLYLVALAVFVFLTTSQFINDAPDAWITFGATMHAVAMLIILYTTRTYRLVAALTVIVGFVINQLNIFTVFNGERFIDLLWILVISFYAFYTLGIKWGLASMIASFLGLTVYIYVVPIEVLVESIMARNSLTELDILINTIVTTGMLCYLLIRISWSIRQAEADFTKVNAALKEQNALIGAQHAEKTVLLKEIHHRVKNNLQIISSLLRMQARDHADPETQVQLYDAVSRIQSMALIHEKMYGTTDLSRIKLKNYLESLLSEIVISYAKEKPVDVKVKSEIDYMSIDHLVPLALIINELATNSLKHGFADQETGIIEIKIKNHPHGSILVYCDSGEWRAPRQQQGFGTMIIQTLTEQLEGSFERTITKGTRYEFRFPNLTD